MVMDNRLQPLESHTGAHKGGTNRIWPWVLLLIALSIVSTPQLLALVFFVSACAIVVIFLTNGSRRPENVPLTGPGWSMYGAKLRSQELLMEAEHIRLAQIAGHQSGGGATPIYAMMYRIGGWLVARGSELQNHYGRRLSEAGESGDEHQKRRSAW
jgi:hypothetical protein